MTASPTREIALFIAKFDPANAALIRAGRSAMRKRLATALELLCDNYNFLAIEYTSSERTSDCGVSLACAANGVLLSLYDAATVPDPDGILLGSGSQIRFVQLRRAAKT